MVSRPTTLERTFEPARSRRYANGHGVAAETPDSAPEITPHPASVADLPGGFPPLRGRGSGKAAWLRTAFRLHEQNEAKAAIVEAQGAVICDMQGEIAQLKSRISEHRPARGRAQSSLERSYFQEIRHRSWARRHRLVVLIAGEAVVAMVVCLWLLSRAL